MPSTSRHRPELVGRNAIDDKWTFEIVETFDDGYYTAFRSHEKSVRDDLLDGQRHIFEAEMKAREQA